MQQFSCPACGKLISAQVAPGTAVQCPLCLETVKVPSAVGALPSATTGPAAMGTPPSGGPGPGPMPYAGGHMEPQRTGMAVTSLVSGVLSLTICPVVAALVGVITGIVALVRANREPQKYGGNGMAVAGIVMSSLGLVVIPLMISILLPSLSRARELSKRTVCAANMRGIGQALYIYAMDEPDGAFPDDITKVLNSGYTTRQQFQCPSSMTPGQQCYYYVPGQTTNSDPSGVLLFEDPQIHGGEGGNVLYQDGHVQFIKFPQYQTIVDEYSDKAQ